MALPNESWRIVARPVDADPTLDGGPLLNRFGPALDVRIFAAVQEFSEPKTPVKKDAAMPGEDGNVGDGIGVAEYESTLRETLVQTSSCRFTSIAYRLIGYSSFTGANL